MASEQAKLADNLAWKAMANRSMRFSAATVLYSYHVVSQLVRQLHYICLVVACMNISPD